MTAPARKIQAVLFLCNLNACRSVMAAALARYYFGQSLYVQSAGVRKGQADSFTHAALAEIGIDIARYQPKTVQELEDWEGLNFDLIISMTPEAHHAAMDMTRLVAAEVEYWPTPEPVIADYARDQILDAYRTVRDALGRKIRARFAS